VTILLAVLLAAVAAALGCGGPPPPMLGPPAVARRRRAVRGWPLLVLALTSAGLIAVLEGRRLALGLVVAATVGGGLLLVRGSRTARAAQARESRVVDACDALAGELRAGQSYVRSLERAAEVWPELRQVLAAARLGGDVPDALRRLAEVPGAEAMRHVASAWAVSAESGPGLAAALEQVATTARSRQATRRLVRGELASAQATARLVALLPLAALAMGSGIGGDPLTFLLQRPLGIVCLAAGCGLALAGLFWIDRIAAGVLRR
jgi:tight adherence protein B